MNKLYFLFIMLIVGSMVQCKKADSTTAQSKKTTAAKKENKSGACESFSIVQASSVSKVNGSYYMLRDGRLMKNSSFNKTGWKALGTQKFSDYAVSEKNGVYAIKNVDKTKRYLYRFDGKGWKKEKGSGFEKIFADNNGVMYTIKNSKNVKGMIYRMDKKGWVKLPNNQFTSVAFDRSNNLFATKNTKNRNGVIYKHTSKGWKSQGATNFNAIGFDKNNQMYGSKTVKNTKSLYVNDKNKWSKKNVRNLVDFQFTGNGDVVYVRTTDKGQTLVTQCGLDQF